MPGQPLLAKVKSTERPMNWSMIDEPFTDENYKAKQWSKAENFKFSGKDAQPEPPDDATDDSSASDSESSSSTDDSSASDSESSTTD